MGHVHGRQINALYRRKSGGNRTILRGELVVNDKCAYGREAIEIRFEDDRGYEYSAILDPEFLRAYLEWFDGLGERRNFATLSR
jgi:hypothetical protein